MDTGLPIPVVICTLVYRPRRGLRQSGRSGTSARFHRDNNFCPYIWTPVR